MWTALESENRKTSVVTKKSKNTSNPKLVIKHYWVDEKDIAKSIKKAVIASEDSNFYSHNGIDWQGIMRAFEKNYAQNRVKVGGSTITQQLAKNLFLTPTRSYWRKGQELIITKMLEFCLDKERILTLYLNFAEWGQGIYGIEAAAQYYFGISAKALNSGQAARLAVLLPAPKRYQKNIYNAYLNRRTQWILQQMVNVVIPP